MKPLRTPGGVVVVAVILGLVVSLKLMVDGGWDPTAFTAFGETTPETAYAEQKLGRSVLTRQDPGHDGRFFFVQSNDPWLVDPVANAQIMDRPSYRSQRMLYPVISGGAGLFSPEVIVWALYVVNLIALGAGTWAVARIAVRRGLPAWVGLAFGLNIGLVFELYIDGAGIVAFALACLGALALEEDRRGAAALWFVGSAMTREVMLLFVGFIWLVWWMRRRERPWLIAVPAGLAVVAWAVYVRLRLGFDMGSSEVRELALVPFSGLIEALRTGLATPLDLVMAGLMAALMVAVPVRAMSSTAYLTWGVVGFAVLGPFLSLFVWQKYFDISRALAPLITAFILELFLARQRRQQREAVA